MIVELERIQLKNEIGETVEKVVKHEIRFVDSFKFMASSLEKLVENLTSCGKCQSCKPGDCLTSDVIGRCGKCENCLLVDKPCFSPVDKFLLETEKHGTHIDLLVKKGVYPYEFMDSFEKFSMELPGKDAFFSRLNGCGISDEDYEHAVEVWKRFGMKNMEEYHDLYLKTDVLLLVNVFEEFRNVCECHYELHAVHYYTTPALAWDAMLEMTGVELELLTDVDMLLMVERGMRGGNSNAFCRFSQANNKFMKEFDESQPSKFLVYLDANNLYGWAMSKPLPVRGFKWLTWDEAVEWEKIVEDPGYGCFLDVDLEYPDELHDEHNDFPLAPESLTLNGFLKLTQNLRNKKRMVLHGENLKQYLSLGMKLKKVKRVLMFREEPFMKAYIDKNTKLRMQAKNAFKKDFFKLMNNSVFGKTMENIRNRVSIHLVKDVERAQKLANKPNFDDLKIFVEFLIAVKMKKTELEFNKPVYVGMSILDLSKTLMYDFHYGYAKKKVGWVESFVYRYRFLGL